MSDSKPSAFQGVLQFNTRSSPRLGCAHTLKVEQVG